MAKYTLVKYIVVKGTVVMLIVRFYNLQIEAHMFHPSVSSILFLIVSHFLTLIIIIMTIIITIMQISIIIVKLIIIITMMIFKAD